MPGVEYTKRAMFLFFPGDQKRDFCSSPIYPRHCQALRLSGSFLDSVLKPSSIAKAIPWPVPLGFLSILCLTQYLVCVCVCVCVCVRERERERRNKHGNERWLAVPKALQTSLGTGKSLSFPD